MKAWDIIGWAYNAALHCPDCASTAGMDCKGAEDSEGNPPGPIFASSELLEVEYCGTCFEPINPD